LDGTIYNDLFLYDSNFVFVNSTSGKVKTKVGTRPCDISDFYNLNEDPLFNKIPVTEFTCFDNNNTISLYGIYTDPIMTYFEYQARINPKYFDEYEKLEKIFLNEQFKMTFYYTDVLYDVSSEDSPVFTNLNSIYTYLDLQFFKRQNVNFQKFIYSEDKNLLIANYKNKTYMNLLSSQEITVSMPSRNITKLSDKQNLAKFFLRAANSIKQVQKSYQKLPEFLAGLSGLLVNLLVVIGIFMHLINQFKATQKVMNKILKYKDNIKEKNQDQLSYLIQKFKENDIVRKITVTPKSNQVSDIENNSNKQHFEFMNSIKDPNALSEKLSPTPKSSRTSSVVNKTVIYKENPLLINSKDIFCLIFCCRSIKLKKKIYDNAEKKFNHYLDLISYMKKMQEIDIIKYLLLDKDTLNLVNFASKPSVSMLESTIDNREYRQFFEVQDESFDMKHDNIDELKRSYLRIKNKEELSSVEKRVIQLFDMQIEEILN
jgi:hypothetical protein